MMAAAAHNHKHLHELLTEDQEPFHLNNYIATKRYQLHHKPTPPSPKPPPTTSTLHLKKRKPINTNPSLCNHACFSFSFQVDSPDVRKSPLFQFQSPSRSPTNKVFLHIPARTAAMLLDAAVRIQKQSTKTKEIKNSSGFGLFGSLLKKLKDRSSMTKKSSGKEFSIKETAAATGTSTSTSTTTLVELDDKKSPLGFSCSCNNSSTPRLSSAGWSESNEEKSLDLETSCSSSRSDHEDAERENGCEKCFCSSPLLLSPFRFALLQSPPSPGRRTPDFLSPAASPSRHDKEEKDICEIESLQNDHVEEEEDKEQCSPVSVLDTLYEDDDDEEHEAVDDDGEDYDRERSYANVQRAKHQLLQKLRRFERLADLDPIELEKRMFGQEDDDLIGEEGSGCDNESYSSEDMNSDELVREVFSKSSLLHPSKVPSHMKRLVSDLISEDNKSGDDNAAITKRVCKRLDSWKEVESNTIDMMVELDFRREVVGWKGFDEELIKETGMDIEVAIFGLLVEELTEELINMDGY